jgi:anti-sigma regulatory factor (Ser/Thr protein kinase)
MPVTNSSTSDGAPSRRPLDTAPAQLRAEIVLPTGTGAPHAARTVIALCLTGLVAPSILHDAALLASELVTNSLEHGELADPDLVRLRVYLAPETLRLEIENPGTAGVVATRRPRGPAPTGGFGLGLVDLLAVRWGVSRNHNTNVWLEMARA